MLDDIEELFQKGVELQKSGKVEVASQFYTAILKAQPEHPDANHNMGVLAVGFDKIQEALPFFEVALEANADTAQFWVSYIDALIKVERMVDAQAVFNQAKDNGAKGEGFDQLEKRLNVPNEVPIESVVGDQEIAPKQPNILDTLKLDQALRLAKKKAKEGSLEDAKRIYRHILVKFSKNKRAIDGIKALANGPVGKASKVQDPPQEKLQPLINLYSQGQLQEALTEAMQLMQQFPNSITLYNIQGAANVGLGRLDDAIEVYSRALTIKPDYADAHNNMGIALKGQGNLDAAIDAYNQALSLKPDYAEAYYNMGNVLRDQGNLEKAIEAYNKALSIKPNYAEAYSNMGLTLQDQGKLEEAIAAFNKAVAINPDCADAYNNMGIALKDQGNLEEAIVDYDKALAIKPDYAEAYYNMGNALQEQGKLEEAIVAYNKALAIKPDYADAYNNMGNALKDQDKLEEAIETYNKALAIKPNYAEAYYNMGGTLKEQDKLEKAIEAYNKALAINPDYANAKHTLSSLTGKTTNSAPREYVENLFDGYASKFDQSLVEELKYDIPKILTNLTAKVHGSGSWGSVLDLGCGTGLTGVEIKEFCSNLEGVDLSNKMLEKARVKGVYDKLSHVDIVEYLSKAELNFDYFFSTDVFIYVGELCEVFSLIKSKNKKSGKLVFSTEHTEREGFHLETSGRYSHSKRYINSLCEKFSYSISHFSETNLRKEKGEFLTGGIYLLDF